VTKVVPEACQGRGRYSNMSVLQTETSQLPKRGRDRPKSRSPKPEANIVTSAIGDTEEVTHVHPHGMGQSQKHQCF